MLHFSSNDHNRLILYKHQTVSSYQHPRGKHFIIWSQLKFTVRVVHSACSKIKLLEDETDTNILFPQRGLCTIRKRFTVGHAITPLISA